MLHRLSGVYVGMSECKDSSLVSAVEGVDNPKTHLCLGAECSLYPEGEAERHIPLGELVDGASIELQNASRKKGFQLEFKRG